MDTPFTKLQFFQVFEEYNAAVFPAQAILLVLVLLAVGISVSGRTITRVIGLFLGLLWIWIGAVYHIAFFSSINPIATAFGALFILEGGLILFATVQGTLSFRRSPSTSQHFLGYLLIFFGLLVYPLISYLTEGSVSRIISVGLPCPSLIVTFGFFLLAAGRVPPILLIIPSLWAVIGTSAAVNFGVYQDFMLIISAALCDIILLKRKAITHAVA